MPYHFEPNDMREQINQVITTKEVRDEHGLLWTVSDGKKTITEYLLSWVFENAVRFIFDEEGIHIKAYATSYSYVAADVQFKDGTFSLKNIMLHEEAVEEADQN